MGKNSKKRYNKNNKAGKKGQQRQQQQQRTTPPTRRSTRLTPNQNNNDSAADTNNNILSTTNPSSTTTSSTTQIVSSKKSSPRKNGVHPTTGHRIRNCICTQSDKCRELMWRLADIDDETMFPYIKLPGHPQAGDKTPTGQHKIEFCSNVYKHLYSEVTSTILRGLPKEQHVALIHFKPAIRDYLESDQSKKQFQWRVPIAIGYGNGLDSSDLCGTEDINGEEGKTCFASPNQSFEDAETEIEEKERIYNEKQLAAGNPTMKRPSADIQSKRKPPNQRRLEKLTCDAENNPRAAAFLIQQLEEKLDAMTLQSKERDKNDLLKEKKHEKEMAEQREEFLQRMIMDGGLSRKSLASDAYHESNPNLSRHLFSRPWGEHKARGMACFGGFVPDFDCNVSGEGEITQFEKYCMACMTAWHGDKQETLAAIYGRSQPAISRYLKEWMPLLDIAGGDMSELDLEMNHNWVSMDEAKNNGRLYMDNGQLKRNGEVVEDEDM